MAREKRKSISRSSIYKPLDQSARSIRLIEILPDGNERISCQFHVFNLSTCPAYIALSYTWGPPSPTEKILIDGHQFRVRENLHLALQSIRNQLHVKSTPQLKHCKFFWIDAICIDQDNVHERNHQVSMMSTLYSQAETVLIWLGPEAEDSDLAMHFLLDLESSLLEAGKEEFGAGKEEFEFGKEELAAHSEARRKGDESNKKRIDQLRNALYNIRHRAFEFVKEDERLRAALSSLNKRSYWTRVWIVQEVLLAKQLIFLCGGQVCEEAAFENIAGQTIDLIEGFRSDRSRTVYVFPLIWERWNVKRYGYGVWDDVTYLVRDWCSQQCGDSRDKVFGLLGLQLVDAEDILVADYQKTVEQVFEDVILYSGRKASDESQFNFVLRMGNLAENLGIGPLDVLLQREGYYKEVHGKKANKGNEGEWSSVFYACVSEYHHSLKGYVLRVRMYQMNAMRKRIWRRARRFGKVGMMMLTTEGRTRYRREYDRRDEEDSMLMEDGTANLSTDTSSSMFEE